MAANLDGVAAIKAMVKRRKARNTQSNIERRGKRHHQYTDLGLAPE
jgi:hypothetical protein